MDSNRRYSPCRPQTAHPSADPLRGNPFDTRDPRICVQPLKGLGKPRAASGSYRASVPAGHGDCGVSPSYRASSPTGESLPLRITATHPILPKSILNSEFLILNWTYTFSAKERDSETGLSYFGSRYYSSDLSIWLSVDPMSDKYAYQSNYVYCSNNPINLVDPNGKKDRPFNRQTDKPKTWIKGTATPIRGINCKGVVVKFDMISVLTSYNCHSYAWHHSQGDKTPGDNDVPYALDNSSLPRWDNNPADDIMEQNAKQLDPSENNIPGDIVVYYTDANSNDRYDDGELISHSAIVKTVDEDGYTTEVIGKNNDKGLSVCHPDAPGYYKTDKNHNPTKRAYFRIPTIEE